MTRAEGPRAGNYQKALELYEKLHPEHPENVECLQYLVALCKELGQPHDHYQAKLSRLERSQQQQSQAQGPLTRAAPPQQQHIPTPAPVARG